MTEQQKFNGLPPFQSELRMIATSPEGEITADRGTVVAKSTGLLFGKFTGPDSDTGWAPLTPVQVVDALADVAPLEGHLDNFILIVLGNTTPFDEGPGAGMWIYQDDSEAAESPGTVIQPDDVEVGDPGRWILLDQAWVGGGE